MYRSAHQPHSSAGCTGNCDGSEASEAMKCAAMKCAATKCAATVAASEIPKGRNSHSILVKRNS